MKPFIVFFMGLIFMSISTDTDFPLSYRQHNAGAGVILATLGFAEGLERIVRRFIK